MSLKRNGRVSLVPSDCGSVVSALVLVIDPGFDPR